MPKILTDPREKMLRQVQQLLERGGYSAVTIRAVAAGCGVSVGTVYNYFPSKDALVAQLLLEDWRGCIAAIEAVRESSDSCRDVAQCIHSQLLLFARRHEGLFRDESARSTFAGTAGAYHGLLRSQLAAPLERFCESSFAAEFIAEALLTWTLSGKEFSQIWGMLNPLIFKGGNPNVQL